MESNLLSCAVAAALLGIAGEAAAEPASRGADLRRMVYDYSVAEYCGLISEPVYVGFQLEMRAFVRDRGLPESTVRWLRIRGMMDADYEYGDRGLGGYRNWCRTEGMAAAARFIAVAAVKP